MRFEGLQRAKGILLNDFQSAVGGLTTLFGSAGAQDEVHLCLGFLSSEQTVASVAAAHVSSGTTAAAAS